MKFKPGDVCVEEINAKIFKIFEILSVFHEVYGPENMECLTFIEDCGYFTMPVLREKITVNKIGEL